MSAKAWTAAAVNRTMRRLGAEIVPSEILYDWQRAPVHGPSWNSWSAPPDTAEYLRADNPKLLDLKRRYREFDPAVTTPLVWTDAKVRPEHVATFRGDNAWLWQLRGQNSNVMAYALSYYYLRSIDRLGLLAALSEDGSFGNFTFQIDGRVVSRDLLDSVAEIYFLDQHLGIASAQGLRVLDVGAGYGRLAHRVVTALPNVEHYLCTDAVAVSTFVCDYYLRFRGLDRARAVPLDEIDSTLAALPVDLAVNIHSFSECRLEAIEWWAELLARHGVRHLMIVPNAILQGGELLRTNDGRDFLPLLERYGYRTIAKEPKFRDPLVQRYGLEPSWSHLLELRAGNGH